MISEGAWLVLAERFVDALEGIADRMDPGESTPRSLITQPWPKETCDDPVAGHLNSLRCELPKGHIGHHRRQWKPGPDIVWANDRRDDRCDFTTSDGHRCARLTLHGPHHQAENGHTWIA